jgi:2-keto-myo-inositol isomerase
MIGPMNRRDMLKKTGGAAIGIAASVTPATAKAQRQTKSEPFIYGLNTSTIRGHKLPLTEVIDITAKAGFRAIEPWMDEINGHVQKGGSLKDVRKQLADHGLAVVSVSAIGFFDWIVDDDARRKKALEQAKRDMDLVQQIGGTGLAAPASGATDRSDINLDLAAERYRTLCELGDQFGVAPQVEVWGFSKTLQRLAPAVYIAIESGHPKACVLADVYHLYKGGSSFDTVKLLSGVAMHNFHLNDYPADPPRDKIGDADRVYPGDGIAPLTQLFRDLRDVGFKGALSVELFNREYYKQDALKVAKTAYEKSRAAVKKAFA